MGTVLVQRVYRSRDPHLRSDLCTRGLSQLILGEPKIPYGTYVCILHYRPAGGLRGIFLATSDLEAREEVFRAEDSSPMAMLALLSYQAVGLHIPRRVVLASAGLVTSLPRQSAFAALPPGFEAPRIEGVGDGYDLLANNPVPIADVTYPPFLNGTWMCQRMVQSVEGDAGQAKGGWKLYGLPPRSCRRPRWLVAARRVTPWQPDGRLVLEYTRLRLLLPWTAMAADVTRLIPVYIGWVVTATFAPLRSISCATSTRAPTASSGWMGANTMASCSTGASR